MTMMRDQPVQIEPGAPRVLVAFGSRRGGTEGLADKIAGVLRAEGLDVTCLRAEQVEEVTAFDAVVLGGALYFGRWVHEARRFARRHAAALRARPVWLFSSGPLDATTQQADLPPVRSVASVMTRLGARGHATFGGRLAADATGVLASAMAKSHAGDWRSWDRVTAWSHDIARALTAAGIAAAPDQPAAAPRV